MGVARTKGGGGGGTPTAFGTSLINVVTRVKTRVLKAVPGPSPQDLAPGPLACKTSVLPVYYEDDVEETETVFKTTSLQPHNLCPFKTAKLFGI